VGHDGTHADARTGPDGDAAQDPGGRADHSALADHDRRGEQLLLAHGTLDVADVVVEVDEDDLVAQARAGADLDALVGRDDAALAQAGVGADGDRGAGTDVEATVVADAAAVAERDDGAGPEVEAHATAQPGTAGGRQAAAGAQAGEGEAQHRRAA
jgi:hypothetical protein